MNVIRKRGSGYHVTVNFGLVFMLFAMYVASVRTVEGTEHGQEAAWGERIKALRVLNPPTACDQLASNPDDPNIAWDGVPFDALRAHADAAISACKEAAERSSAPRHYYQLGRSLAAKGVFFDAVRWYTQAAKADYVPAFSGLAASYLRIDATPKQSEEVIAVLRTGAEKGYVSAMWALGYLYGSGEAAPHLLKDNKQAEKWYLKAAESGDAGAMNNLGSIYEQQGKEDEAEKWYLRSAQVGMVTAMVNLGTFYMSRNDSDGALHWYKRAAERGHALAALAVGDHYYAEENYARAVKWYLMADTEGASLTRAGRAHLHTRLGVMYELGQGTEVNYDKAMSRYQKAVELEVTKAEARGLSSADAASHLAVLYEEGKGTSRDLGAARRWYARAAKYGSEEGASKAQQLAEEQETKLRAEARAEARKRKCRVVYEQLERLGMVDRKPAQALLTMKMQGCM